MKKNSNETKIGLIVFLAFVCLLVMIFSVGKFNLFEKGYNFFLIFDYAAGLKPKSSVYLSGIKAGKVVSVKIAEKKDKNFVVVKIWVPEEIKIRKNSQFYINSLGLMGEKIIDITQGTKNFPLIKKNEVFKGKNPVHYAIVSDIIEDITQKIQEVVEKISTDEKTQDKIKKIVDNIYLSTEKLNILLDKNHLGEIVENSKKISSELEKNAKNANITLENLNDLINANKKNLEQVLINIKEITADQKMKNAISNLEKITNQLSTIISQIEQNKGTLGKLIQEKDLYNNIFETTKNLKELTEDLKKNPWKLLKKK